MTVRIDNFGFTIEELNKLLLHLKDIQLVYLKPMKLESEQTDLKEAERFIKRIIHRLERKSKIAKYVSEK